MAARILEDTLNNFLPLQCLLEWLCNKYPVNEENIFIHEYDCSQVEFVSYFLGFLREQSSREFQVYDTETPRKNSHSILSKIPTNNSDKPSQLKQLQHDLSPIVNQLDLDSLNSFPSLSSSSSKLDSLKNVNSESTLEKNCTNKNNFEKSLRRVKLFSETVEGNIKTNSKEFVFLDDINVKQNHENHLLVSTPKQTVKYCSFPSIDFFNTSDCQEENSPKLGVKSKYINQSLELSSPEINLSTSRYKSFSSDSSFGSKDNKINCRVSLGDFILSDLSTSDSKKDKKNKARKKINSVKLNTHTGTGNLVVEKTDNFLDSNKFKVPEENSNVKEINSNNSEEDKVINTVKNILNSSIERHVEPHLVTYISELKILSQIYSCLINENYCQNIMIELCFIISLLVIQDYNKKMSGRDSEEQNKSLICKKQLFGSTHNCVFFAVETLWLQKNILLLLNLSAIKLLSDNVRIEKFNILLKEFLVNSYHQKKCSEEVKRPNGVLKAGMQGNVSFQYETDNRENFTSDVSFHSFRKQRDLFYNILSIWEANHLISGWVFSIGLGSKIRSLLSISSDPINLLHLARLFRNQLIMSCCGENQTEEDFNEEILQLLPSADPNKILRLRARLTSSPKRQGPCPPPDFTGNQEFYKNFILCTSHATFHEYLKNSLCDEILRLNDNDLMEDVEEHDLCLDEQAQERYLQYISILRILAKFLGFVEFLPYRGEKPLSNRILNIHCSVRRNILPMFNIVSYLKGALNKQKLMLTIPWMVSYLSMIDSYSSHLAAYQEVWNLLILIYKQLKSYKNPKNNFYLKLTLGWIFQLPNFPSDQFYSVLDEHNKNLNDSVEDLFANERKIGLDFYDFVDENILYTICPYLSEINAILRENEGCSVKHIRPLTTQKSPVTKFQASKQLELRLESNFLHNQSSSTRKTVEFVTERVASISVKHLIQNVIPQIKGTAWTKLENILNNESKEVEVETDNLSECCFKEILAVCEKESWEISSKHSKLALKALLSIDLQQSVADTCWKIVTRQAAEKVQRWMQSHVTQAMVKKEFLSLSKKKLAKKCTDIVTLDVSELHSNRRASQKNFRYLNSSETGTFHDKEAWAPSTALKNVRDLILKIHEGSSASQQNIKQVIEEAIKTIKRRSDIIPAAEKALYALIIDLIICCCVFCEDEVPRETFNVFFQILKSSNSDKLIKASLETIVCPRNVAMILNKAKNKKKAWANLGNLLLYLMEEEKLTKEQIESQLLSLLRKNWEKESGIQFSSFISSILEEYSKNHGCDEFSLLLEYMLDTLNDDESKSESLG